MALLLVCTLGSAPQPLIRSILAEPRPEKVLFICSRETCPTIETEIVPKVAEEGFPLLLAQREKFELSDPQALDVCVREIARQLTPQIRSWRNRPDGEVIVDPTGGTKVMSMALALVARRWHCTFRYIGGKQREQRPSGPGVVVTGTEEVLHTHNPLDLLGYQLAEDALTLARAGNYATAQSQLKDGARQASDPGIKRSLQTLANLLGIFALWDQFDHSGAVRQLEDLEKNRNDLYHFLDEESCRTIENSLGGWKRRLEILAKGRPSRELIEDLLANAERRIGEGRHDDAVARLYRATEAMAQWRLADRHHIPDTGAVPWDRIPEPLRSGLRPRDDGAVELALQNAYRLLEALGDALGARFRELNLDHPQQSPLAERNQSILAHGWKPVSAKGCDALWRKVLELASEVEISEQNLLRFPELRSRLG